jgi:battenin
MDLDGTPLMTERSSAIRGTPSSRRNLLSFFIFGLVNNVIYVIFLSAAEDILQRNQGIRKSSVLLADILPCLVVKFIAPYFVRVVPYGAMVSACTILSIASLLLVAWGEPIWIKFIGIILASASSGLGETSYLALTSYFNPQVVIAWSSGTGAAGIVGAVYYLLFTSVLGFNMSMTITLACILPVIMAATFTLLLCKNEHREVRIESGPASPILDDEEGYKDGTPSKSIVASDTLFYSRVKMIRPLIFRYILPLFLVYYAEYTINQGVFFSLLYPLGDTPFRAYKDHYKTYSAIYQAGVFISRTFGRRLPITNGWILAIMQCGMLILLTGESLYMYINQIYVIFVLVFLEGLLGGAAYVNTFCNITEQVERANLEFSMAFTGIADSMGIGLAGVTCLFFEPFLCRHNTICRTIRNL